REEQLERRGQEGCELSGPFLHRRNRRHRAKSPQSEEPDYARLRRSRAISAILGIARGTNQLGILPSNTSSVPQTESHNRISAHAARGFRFLDQRQLQVVGIGDHFARGNLLVAGAVIAEFAHTQGAFRAGTHWWPKRTAGHGTRGVEIAQPGGGIESRTRFVVGKAGKALLGFSVFRQDSRRRVAGKSRSQTGGGFPGAIAYPRCARGIARFQLL